MLLPTPRGSDILGSTSSCSTTRTVFAAQNASQTENMNSSTPPSVSEISPNLNWCVSTPATASRIGR